MSTPLKRKLSSATRSVSPPPIRGRLTTPNPPPTSAQPLNDHIFTFYSWNVNSITPLLQKKLTFSQTPSTSAPTYPLRIFLRDHNWPHLLALQEVKINRLDTKTQRLTAAAANAGSTPTEPTYTTHFSLPRDKYNATGFGGKVHGVATLIRDDISLPSSISKSSPIPITISTTKPDWDLEGRVLVHTLHPLNLTIINGYWPNGTANPYRDPTTGLTTSTRHDHKLRFHTHMLRTAQHLEASGTPVLLLGDMNIAPTRLDGHPNLRTIPVQHVMNRSDFNAKFLGDRNAEGLGGVDLFRYFHGTERKYTYHGRGRPWGESCDRVDLVVGSLGLVEGGGVVDSDICESPGERGHSDHVPIWVKIDVTKIYGAGSGLRSDDTVVVDHG